MLSSSTWLSSHNIREVCCIGAGFVVSISIYGLPAWANLCPTPTNNDTQGGSTGAVLASQVKNVNVTVVDINQARIDAWNSQCLPISEPGLDDLVELSRGLRGLTQLLSQRQVSNVAAFPHKDSGAHKLDECTDGNANLFFTTDVDSSIRKADLIFVCVDTPSMTGDGLLGRALDTRALHKAVQRVGEVAVQNFILVEKCTVPCGTAQQIENILQGTVCTGVHFEVLSNPEFLAEGSAVQDLLHPSRVLIGSFPTQTGMSAALALASVYEQWVPRERILTIDTWSSELAKLAANALLAQRISSINSLSMVCESMNADIRTVSKMCALDERIGPHMLNASVGFGGSCFHKDVSYLVYLAASLNLDHVARYWQAVLDMNEQQQIRFSERVVRRLGNLEPARTKIAVLGFAFKANTNDTRNSAAIQVVRDLVSKGFQIAIYDPWVGDVEILAALSYGSGVPPKQVSICSSSREACVEASAVVILTEWDGFRYPPTARNIDETATYNDCPPTPESLEQCESPTCEQTGLNGAYRVIDPGDDNSSIGGEMPEMNKPDQEEPVSPDRVSMMNVHRSKRQPRSLTSQVHEHIRWDEVAKVMLEPKQIFDGRNIIADDITDLGFRIERIGKTPSLG